MNHKLPVTLSVNQVQHSVKVLAQDTLLAVLRDKLGLIGAKRGCNQGICGTCTVLKDGSPVRACLSLAINSTDCEITTIEGLATPENLSPLQSALARSGGVQCGFCTSGMLLSAHALLKDNPKPSEDDIRVGLSGNLCRCTGYKKIVEAVLEAAREIQK